MPRPLSWHRSPITSIRTALSNEHMTPKTADGRCSRSTLTRPTSVQHPAGALGLLVANRGRACSDALTRTITPQGQRFLVLGQLHKRGAV